MSSQCQADESSDDRTSDTTTATQAVEFNTRCQLQHTGPVMKQQSHQCSELKGRRKQFEEDKTNDEQSKLLTL